ncbi:succinate dehydrogenase [Telmatospirillum sp. J64-1]|uniref:succinate dehydrogenase, cytochrome b556 subunit n=1 Tax=Telmatospirillum sp. J64-1 TaxID=2502183 RepID=UPI00115D92C8|nr:succinate dehydrogenase [Telmatospirillum sp. J64-1]
MIRPHRNHPLWFAFIVHRLSGLALVIFLPMHFYVLGMALTNVDQLDSFLQWSNNPVSKAAEFGLVFLLAVHLFGGLRLLVLENFDWRDWQKSLAAASAGLAFVVAGGFLLNVV